MKSAASNNDSAPASATQDAPSIPWLRATRADLAGLDFEAPAADSKSADAGELSDLFQAAMSKDAQGNPNTAADRVFSMLASVTRMHFKPNERNEPFGPMAVFPDGRRTAVPADFRGPPVEVIAEMAGAAKHPALRARLADVSWLLERKRAALGASAVSAYAEIVAKVDSGDLAFRFDEDEKGALKHDARDLLLRSLQIGRAIGWDKPETIAARNLVAALRTRAADKALPVPTLWFSELDLSFGVSDPSNVAASIEQVIGAQNGPDSNILIELWRAAARGYHIAKNTNDAYRCQAEAAEQMVRMAERKSGTPLSGMMASHHLAAAIAELHGIPGKKERRRELRHRLVDAQASITEEMSPFALPMDLEKLAKHVERQMDRPSLRDKLFMFAALGSSPDPADLRTRAIESIRKHPLSSLFGASHHDSEGKVVHRSGGGGFGEENESAIQRQIAQDEGIRRKIMASGEIDVARQVITTAHFIADDMLLALLSYSPFVPHDLVATFSRGFTRFFQGDFVSATYILTPLLENSLRHVLKAHGHDVTIFDDATQTQQDRSISSLFEQMRTEMNEVLTEAIATDIENVFLKKPGPSLRHALAHGLLHDGAPYGADAIYGCWLIFRLCLLPLFPHHEEIQLPFD